MPKLLDVKGITKSYPGVVANRDVSLQIEEGEIHALLGENGAGKSTLVKILYGLVRPDSGQIEMQGARFEPREPCDARKAGIAMVFQHFNLFDALSVAENIALGMQNSPPMRALSEKIREVSHSYGLPLEPDQLSGMLSAGERQRIEIIRCLLQDPKLLIMDEPTSVLTPQEVEILFETLRCIKAEGRSILYISHKLEEIRTLCDTATILRRGTVVAKMDPAKSSVQELAEMMVGAGLHKPRREVKAFGDPVLKLELSSPFRPVGSAEVLRKAAFKLRRGEILGVGGVSGNGQCALLSVLSGEGRTAPGTVFFESSDISNFGPEARRALGVLSAPEERLGHAAVPDMSLSENTLISGAKRSNLTWKGFLNRERTTAFANKIIESFDVQTSGPHHAASSLSGGNLQKFVVGREILQAPEVLIVNQPTWGVDAAAAATIRQAILDIVASGAAVVLISQDLDELLEVATHFAALFEGNLSAKQEISALDMEKIGLMLGGSEQAQDADYAL